MIIHIQALDHIVLNVADVDASLSFYCAKLGLQPERIAAFYAGEASFPSVRVTPQTIIDLFPPALHPNEGSGTNLNHIAFDVRESSAGIERFLKSRAIQIERRSKRTFGARGKSHLSLYIRDPDGNVVELRSYAG